MNINDIWQVPEDGWNENPVDTLTAAIQASPTEAGIKHLATADRALREMAETYFWQRYKADPAWRKTDDCEDAGGWLYTPSIDEIEFDEDEVTIRCSARACSRGCCGYDRRTYEFPLSYLWLDQTAVLADLATKEEARKRAEEAEERRREAEAKKRREEEERRRLKELAAKYPEEIKP
ncbi:MAG: hypothetical protein A2Y38_06345 [Spirochaetes bacterium GWB1_59_5]|nr:MAG: hypothetical protein A2Y38_06345 [Spirochaetes bacterium GWB1_59_5]